MRKHSQTVMNIALDNFITIKKTNYIPMKKILLLSLVIATSMLVKAQKNHKGFFLSMGAGPVFGPIHMNSNVDGEYDMNGVGAAFDLKIGGTIKENLILHATLLSSALTGPKITQNTGGSIKASDNLSIGETLLGAGLTYYFMPINAFVSGSAGIGNFTIDNQDIKYKATTDRGLGLQFKIGKEWWVSNRWGLGVALTYGRTNVNNEPGNNLVEKLSSSRFGIQFNATLN